MIDLKKNSNFLVIENIFIDIDVEKLNVVFSFSRYAQVNEDDDNHEINKKDCKEADDESIEEEGDNFNQFAKHNSVMS